MKTLIRRVGLAFAFACALGLVFLGLASPAISAVITKGSTENGKVSLRTPSGTVQPTMETVPSGGGRAEKQKHVLFFSITALGSLGDSGWLDTRGYTVLVINVKKNGGDSTIYVDTTSLSTGATLATDSDAGNNQWSNYGTTDVVAVTVSPLGAWTKVRVPATTGGGSGTGATTYSAGGVFRVGQ